MLKLIGCYFYDMKDYIMQTKVNETTRSKFLKILLNNPDINSLPEEKMRKRISDIMKDIDEDGVLDPINYNNNDDWDDDLDIMSEINFDESRTKEEKAIALEFLQKPKKKRREENSETVILESLKRIRQKRRELAENPASGIVLNDDDFEEEERAAKGKTVMPNTYGRTPLHEAIGMRDLEAIERFVIEKQYLKDRDNNGNTPYQMAFQEGYKEAVEIFKKANVSI